MAALSKQPIHPPKLVGRHDTKAPLIAGIDSGFATSKVGHCGSSHSGTNPEHYCYRRWTQVGSFQLAPSWKNCRNHPFLARLRIGAEALYPYHLRMGCSRL